MSQGGCVVSQPGFCGQLMPFDGKDQCFESERDCLKQFESPAMEGNKGSRGHRDMEKHCGNLFMFCAQCGMKGGPPCQSDKYFYKYRD